MGANDMLFIPDTVPETIGKGNTQNFHLIVVYGERRKKRQNKMYN